MDAALSLILKFCKCSCCVIVLDYSVIIIIITACSYIPCDYHNTCKSSDLRRWHSNLQALKNSFGSQQLESEWHVM